MNSVRVVFRADASVVMGNGHIMRCLTLARLFREGGAEVLFICREHTGHRIDTLRAQGFAVALLPALPPADYAENRSPYAGWLGATQAVDAAQTAAAIETHFPARKTPDNRRVDYLIVDHYGIDSAWHTVLRPSARFIAAFDDLCDREYDCDLLLDQTLSRNPADYGPKTPAQCVVLAGTAFAVLRPEFAAARKNLSGTDLDARRAPAGWSPWMGDIKTLVRRMPADSGHVVISMGGTDPNNLTGTVLDALRPLVQEGRLQVDIVLARNARYLTELEHTLKHSPPQVRLHIDLDAESMALLLSNVDFAIGAPGSAAWERCCLGVPSIVVITAANQQLTAKALQAQGAVIVAGEGAEVQSNPATIIRRRIEALMCNPELLRTMREKALRLVDGAGGTRVARLFQVLPLLHEVTLRPLAVGDCKRVYEWQTQPSLRRYFLNPAVPSWDEHCAWFERRLASAGVIDFIVEYRGEACGLLRFDPRGDSGPVDELKGAHRVFEVSILINQHHQGKAIALRALLLAERRVPSITVVARVHEQNEASRRLFLNLGFYQINSTGYLKHFTGKKPVLNQG